MGLPVQEPIIGKRVMTEAFQQVLAMPKRAPRVIPYDGPWGVRKKVREHLSCLVEMARAHDALRRRPSEEE